MMCDRPDQNPASAWTHNTGINNQRDDISGESLATTNVVIQAGLGIDDKVAKKKNDGIKAGGHGEQR
jgi:hypothetical protein